MTCPRICSCRSSSPTAPSRRSRAVTNINMGGSMLKSLRSARMQELTRSALLAALTVLFMPLQPAAGAAATHHHYVLVDIGTLPGLSIYNRPVTTNLSTPTEYEQVLTNRGTLVGGADTPIENEN